MALALTIASISSFAKGASASDIMVMDASAGKSLTPVATSASVYVTIMNHGATSQTLQAVTTNRAEHATIHQNVDKDGVISMQELETLVIAPMQTVNMKAEGLHIMLTGLKSPLRVGETVKLQLQFGAADIIAVDAVVGDLPVGSHNAKDHVNTTVD